MTKEQYQTILEGCDFRQPEQVSKLVTASYTDVMFNNDVQERQVNNPVGAYNFFKGFFGTEVWPDGQGMDEVREFYADPYIPFTFSHFVRQSAICDPNLANECDRDRCQVPEGGRGTMKPFVFYKWGFETPRDCIANIRSIKNFKYWARKIIRSRELMDEQVMNMFYTMAAIQTSGHKVTMQGVRDAAGNLTLAQSNNPRNPVRGGLYNYMEDKFPAPTDMETIAPLTVDTLEGLARYWSQFPANNEVAKGPRGENIYEFWFPDDWFYTEAVRNADLMEKMKFTMPAKLFAGHSLNGGEREIIGNWAARIMPMLPRFAPTADGRIVPVDSHVGIDIEVGKEHVGSIAFENAPFGIAIIPSSRQGTILSRPPLTESGAGFPILPITGDSGWRVRNDYDKECNKDKNKPYSEKDYEMGIRLDDPKASLSFLFRRRKFAMAPIQDCDLAPIFQVIPNDVDCPITEVGCSSGKVRENSDITQSEGFQYVECTAASCGNTSSQPFHYTIKVLRKPNNPDFNSLGCVCGSTLNLAVYDNEGVYARQIQGVLKDDIMGFPYARYFIETTTALADGECIKGISCADSTRLQGNVIDAWDIDGGDVGFILDSPITCGESDDVKITYYSITGASLGVINGVIEQYDPSRYYYRVSSVNGLFKADGVYAGQVSSGISCNEAPNASSSSSN